MTQLTYQGKRVVIAGCVSGIGAAVAKELIELGGEVHGVDIHPSDLPLATFRRMDLKNPDSIDAAVAAIGGRIDALFNCAGLPQTFPMMDVMKVNFIGMRHWTEAWLSRMRKGGAVATIASNAAHRYLARLPTTSELVGTADFHAAVKWVEANEKLVGDGYGFSKEAIVVYTQRRAAEVAKAQIRMNVTLPGPVSTPMMNDFAKIAPPRVFEVFSEPVGRFSTAAEQADPLLFLNSDLARFVSGHALMVDGGFVGGVLTGVIDVPKLLAGA